MARSLGLYLIGVFGIQTSVPCDFTYLPWLIVVSHTLLPLLAVPLTWALIPRAKMADDLQAPRAEIVGVEYFTPRRPRAAPDGLSPSQDPDAPLIMNQFDFVDD